MVVTGYTMISEIVGGVADFGDLVIRSEWLRGCSAIVLLMGMSETIGIPTPHPGQMTLKSVG